MDYSQIVSIIIIGYCFVLGLSIFSHFLINSFISKEIKSKNGLAYLINGVSLFAGSLLFVTLYAILKTKGNTIFIINALIITYIYIKARKGMGYFFLSKKSFHVDKNLLLQVTVYYLIATVLIFFFLNNYFKAGFMAEPHPDVAYYSNIVSGMNRFGAENTEAQYNLINNSAYMRQPYHYFELWFAAGFSAIFGFSEFYTYLIFPNIIFLTIIMLAIYNMAIYLKVDKRLCWIIPIIIFIHPFLSIEFISNSKVYTIPPLLYPKISLFYVFLFEFIMLFLFLRRSAFTALLFLPVASFTALPGLLGAIMAVNILYLLRGKNFREIIKALFPFFIITLLIFLYYYINSTFSKQEAINYQLGDLFSEYWKIKFNIILASILMLMIGIIFPLFIVILIFLNFYDFKNLNFQKGIILEYLFFCIGGFVGGLSAWILFFKIHDSEQFLVNFNISTFSIGAILVIIFLATNLKKKPWFLPGFGGILTAISVLFIARDHNSSGTQYSTGKKYSEKFVEKCHVEMKKADSNYFVGFLIPQHLYNNEYSCNEKVATLGSVLKLSDSRISLISISSHLAKLKKWENKLEQERVNVALSNSPFLKYLEENKIDYNSNTQLDSAIISFLELYKIRFVFVHKDFQLSNYFLKYFEKDAIVDQYTGDKFYKML